MKKLLILALATGLFNVVFLTNLECGHCKKKIEENISFEKGVKDLRVDIESKKVEITFDSAKTDTLKLGNAIRHLGYKAEVVSYSPAKKK
ncbi:MAG: heavy-metal-associated domain-containing protein [Bacteroidales bacterium]|nr:heavy-metal-associated domain-containing protein [Bacteroidales bacterium]